MRRFTSIICSTLALLSVSCGKPVPDTNTDPEIIDEEPKIDTQIVEDQMSAADIQGTWIIEEEKMTKTLTIGKDTFILSVNWNEDKRFQQDDYKEMGPYSFSDGEITWHFTQYEYKGAVYDSENPESFTGKVKGMFNKDVLLIEVPYSPYTSRYYPYAKHLYDGKDNLLFYYRENANLSVAPESVQGKWLWKDGEKECISLELNGNQYDLYYKAWNYRYTGSFAYENGYIKMKDVHFTFLKMNDDGSISWAEPEPYTTYSDPYSGLKSFSMPFLPVTKDIAYSRNYNVTGFFVRQ